MRVIGLGLLSAFCDKRTDCRKWVSNWIRDVKQSTWAVAQDIKSRYPSTSFYADNVTVFNVQGNNYRLETQIAFGVGTVAVKWIGTCTEYEKRKSKNEVQGP